MGFPQSLGQLSKFPTWREDVTEAGMRRSPNGVVLYLEKMDEHGQQGHTTNMVWIPGGKSLQP